jgi:hypothetical protein
MFMAFLSKPAHRPWLVQLLAVLLAAGVALLALD